MRLKKHLHIVLLFILLTGCFTLSAQNVTSDSIVIDYFENQGIPTTYHNRVHLLKSGQEKFEDLFEYIRQAKHHIHLEYLISEMTPLPELYSIYWAKKPKKA